MVIREKEAFFCLFIFQEIKEKEKSNQIDKMKRK